MSLLADILGTLFERRYAGHPGKGSGRSMDALCRELLSSRGEVSGMRLAHEILDRYSAMGEAERRDFFAMLAEAMDIDPDAIVAAAEAVRQDKTPEAYARLMLVSEPARQELARRLNQVPGATARLVAIRTDLLRFSRDDPDLARIDLDFQHLFASWFNRGFLVLRPVNWQSPANILEKIIAYEAVHAIRSWDDLRLRLEPEDRRCFAFFHPSMPDEPLIFVEVALTWGIPSSIQSVLAEARDPVPAAEADTAVFYSISNCQAGLAGISFGNSLIKQVVADLSRELPHLKTFVTLSPLPRFARWLEEEGLGAELLAAAGAGARALEPLAEPARRLAARYLLGARRGAAPYDPVARFHLNNGATVHEVHALADLSPNGLKQSCGVMVNYLYDLDRIEANHEAFADKGRIAASRGVEALARAAEAARKPAKSGSEADEPSA